jgi:hypothetical protein
MNNSFYEQIEYLMEECRKGSISVHELMKLIDMAYKDYLEFHPDELDNYYKSKTDKKLQNGDSERSINQTNQ